MKKKIFLLLCLLTAFFCKAQVNIPYQEIHYNVHYHWGIVNVMIAHGLVTVQADDSRNFLATLDGNSIPWEGRVLCVSDTLKAVMTSPPDVSHETVTYVNGWYMKPKVSSYRSEKFDTQNPANYKNILGGGTLDASSSTMEAIDVTANMLGMFYYYHELKLENMKDGQQTTIPISLPGGGSEKVVVTFNGKSQYKIGGVTYPVYDTTFEYSYKGSMSGYPVKCLVGANDRLPIYFGASLPVGHVEMIYDPQ